MECKILNLNKINIALISKCVKMNIELCKCVCMGEYTMKQFSKDGIRFGIGLSTDLVRFSECKIRRHPPTGAVKANSAIQANFTLHIR